MEGRRRRSTHSDQNSTVNDRHSLAGYTLDDVLAYNKQLAPPVSATARAADLRNRTLLDIIRDDKHGAGKGIFGHKDKRTWKSFRDKLRLKRAGSAWVSTVPIPTSDIPVHNRRFPPNKRNQIRFDTVSPRHSGEVSKSPRASSDSNLALISSPKSRSGSNESIGSESSQYDDSPDTSPVRITRPQISRHNSVRVSNDPNEPERDNRIRHISVSTAILEERTLSAREAVAAQEAADAAAAAVAAATEAAEDDDDDENEGSMTESESESSSAAAQPVRMSLMDLLQETDGSSYRMGDESDDDDDEFYEYDDDDEEEYEEDEEGEESNCCVCRIRHRGAAMIPCGHTFCRMCSKELMVSRGNCPTCNSFILEALHVF